MKLFYSIIALQPIAIALAADKRQGFSPQSCGNICRDTLGSTSYPCTYNDFKCICQRPESAAAFDKCLNAMCRNPSDIAAGANVYTVTCANAGAPNADPSRASSIVSATLSSLAAAAASSIDAASRTSAAAPSGSISPSSAAGSQGAASPSISSRAWAAPTAAVGVLGVMVFAAGAVAAV